MRTPSRAKRARSGTTARSVADSTGEIGGIRVDFAHPRLALQARPEIGREGRELLVVGTAQRELVRGCGLGAAAAEPGAIARHRDFGARDRRRLGDQFLLDDARHRREGERRIEPHVEIAAVVHHVGLHLIDVAPSPVGMLEHVGFEAAHQKIRALDVGAARQHDGDAHAGVGIRCEHRAAPDPRLEDPQACGQEHEGGDERPHGPAEHTLENRCVEVFDGWQVKS
jgi:hypothetical protein